MNNQITADFKKMVLDTWEVHNEINLFLISEIPAKAFEAVPAGSKGRTVTEQFVHMCRVRLGWVHYHKTGIRPKTSKMQDISISKGPLKKFIKDSGEEVADFLFGSLEGKLKIRAFKGNPVRWMGYLISHESHHRGSIMLALKQNGMKLDEKVLLEGLWGKWMWDK